MKIGAAFSRYHGYTVTVHLPKLSRYVLRETFWLYLLGVASFCLLLSIDFLTVWAQFLIEQEASLLVVAKLMLFKLPFFLHLSLPVAVVFAVLLATGRLAKDSELKAAYSLGAKPLALLKPLLLFGLSISVLTVINNGFLEPIADVRYDQLVDSFFYTRPPAEVQTNVSYKNDAVGVYYASRVRIDEDNRNLADLNGILIIRNDGTTISAPEGSWDSAAQTWTLQRAQILRPDKNSQTVSEVILPFETDTSASTNLAKSERLTLTALIRQLESVARAGGETRELAFNLHRRLADAFSALIFVLVSGTLGLHLRGRSAGFGWTIVLLVVFWALWVLSGDLFEQRVLSPFFAAWFTSLVVGAFGSLLAFWRLR